MARSPKTPDTTTKPATPRAEIPASPPVTFNLDDVNKIVSEALAKQAAAMAVAKHSNGKSDVSTKNDWTCTKAF